MKRIAIILVVTLSCQLAPAGDWPEWRGRGRLGIWKETGILDAAFPKEGLAVKWRGPRQIQLTLKLFDLDPGEALA